MGRAERKTWKRKNGPPGPDSSRFRWIKKRTIRDLIAQGDIETLCGSATGHSFCIATDGVAPTLTEIKQFAPHWFEEDEDAWWLCEIDEQDAVSSYAMDAVDADFPIFTGRDQHTKPTLRCFALFLDSEWAHSVTVASGLTLEEARDRYLKLSAPGCEKFVMIERNYHSRDSERYLLLRVKDLGECVKAGSLEDVISHLKDYQVGADEFRMVVAR